MPVRVSKDDFNTQVLEEALPVLVEFYSDSCIPCKRLAPVLADLEEQYEGQLRIVKVNAAYDSELADQYEVAASPTLVFFERGTETDRIRGMVTEDELAKRIDTILQRKAGIEA